MPPCLFGTCTILTVCTDRRGHEAAPGLSCPHRGRDGAHRRGEGHQRSRGQRTVADGS